MFLQLETLENRTIVMVPPNINQRSSPRKLMVCPISINSPSGIAHGILRDVSVGGIFFYSKFRPSLGMTLQFSFRVNDRNVTGTGEVLRIEENAPGAAIGVAMKITSREEAEASS